jgi:hypothetical protein
MAICTIAEGECRAAAGALLATFNRMVDFHGRLDQKEDAAAAQDDVAPRELIAPKSGDRRHQAGHPGDREQQRKAGQQGQAQAPFPGLILLFRLAARGDDLHEHQIVDAQHDLERRQGQERRQGFRGQYLGQLELGHLELPLLQRMGGRLKPPAVGCRRHIGKRAGFRQPGCPENQDDEFAATRELICQSRCNPGILASQRSFPQSFRTIP